MANQLCVVVGGRTVSVTLRRKKVKRLTLRLDRAGCPVLTLPLRCPLAEAERFLHQSAGWLESQLSAPRSFFTLPDALHPGDEILLLGARRRLRLAAGSRPALALTEGEALLCCRHPEDPAQAAAALETAMRALAKERFSAALAEWQELCGRTPILTVKAMTSRWGSANPKTGRINLSLFLLKAPPACIRYVALHEAAHFKEANHGAAFHRILEERLPNYRELERQLRLLARS